MCQKRKIDRTKIESINDFVLSYSRKVASKSKIQARAVVHYEGAPAQKLSCRLSFFYDVPFALLGVYRRSKRMRNILHASLFHFGLRCWLVGVFFILGKTFLEGGKMRSLQFIRSIPPLRSKLPIKKCKGRNFQGFLKAPEFKMS